MIYSNKSYTRYYKTKVCYNEKLSKILKRNKKYDRSPHYKRLTLVHFHSLYQICNPIAGGIRRQRNKRLNKSKKFKKRKNRRKNPKKRRLLLSSRRSNR